MTNNNTSGIYIITHRDTGKSYVGASSNLPKREYHHFRALHLGNHYCEEMLVDFQTTGTGNTAMEFCVLEYCPNDKLTDREQAHIDALQPVYNRNCAGGGLRTVSDNEREKMRKRWIGKQMRNVGTFQTPWGSFTSSAQASREVDGLISQPAIWNVCTKSEKVITRLAFGKSRYLMQNFDESVVGKTWADLGFDFVPNVKN